METRPLITDDSSKEFFVVCHHEMKHSQEALLESEDIAPPVLTRSNARDEDEISEEIQSSYSATKTIKKIKKYLILELTSESAFDKEFKQDWKILDKTKAQSLLDSKVVIDLTHQYLLQKFIKSRKSATFFEYFKKFYSYINTMFFQMELTAEDISETEEYILQAIKIGQFADEFFQEHLSSLSNETTYQEFIKGYKLGKDMSAFSNLQCCILKCFLLNPGDKMSLNEFVELLFEKVLADNTDEIQIHFTNIMLFQMFFAIKHGLKFNDPWEKIEAALFKQDKRVTSGTAMIVAMILMNENTIEQAEKYVRMELEKHQQLEQELKGFPEEIHEHFTKTLSLYYSLDKSFECRFDPHDRRFSISDVRRLLLFFPLEEDATTRSFFNKFIQQKNYPTFGRFFNAIYFCKKAEMEMKQHEAPKP